MKVLSFILVIICLAFTPDNNPKFREDQLHYTRVKEAYKNQWNKVQAYLQSAGVNPKQYSVFIRGFKFEEDLEIWAKDSTMDSFVLVKTYKWCSNVGLLGPKRKEGDLQIPEGIYRLSKFNPESSFHLSLMVNYPNKSDSILGYAPRLGGLIFIHGGCKSIGCIPITDEYIEELYIMCMQARHYGQKNIPIHLLPARLTEQNMNLLEEQYSRDPDLINFWKQLQVSYTLFEENRSLPKCTIDNRGNYHFQP